MKSVRIVSILIVLVMAFSSCSSTTIVKTNAKTKKAPPGQVKKATGSKSAAPYAPGQKKKKN
jgi:hypothetical protein